MIQATVTLKLDGLERFKDKLDGSPPITAALKQWGARYRGFVQRRFDKYSKGGGDWAPLSRRTLLARRGAPKLTSFRKKKFAKVFKAKRVRPAGKALARLDKRINKARKAGKAQIVTDLTNQRADLKRRKAGLRRDERMHRDNKRAVSKQAHDKREVKRQVRHEMKNERKLKAFRVTILRDTGLLFAGLNPVLSVGGVERLAGLSVTVGYGGPAKHGKSRATIADIASFHNLGSGRLPRRRIIVEPSPEVLKQMAGDMNRALKVLADEVSK